jgi:hypothetical protein
VRELQPIFGHVPIAPLAYVSIILIVGGTIAVGCLYAGITRFRKKDAEDREAAPKYIVGAIIAATVVFFAPQIVEFFYR